MKDQESIQNSHAWARHLRRQIQEAAVTVRFTSPIAEIPGDEYHEQVHGWQG